MRRRSSILVTLAVALAGTLLATPSPAVSDPSRSVRPGRRPDRRLDAGGLHRARLRPVRRADPGCHGRVDQAPPPSGPWESTSPGTHGACRTQPNLSPAWVSHAGVALGWRLLPIALGTAGVLPRPCSPVTRTTSRSTPVPPGGTLAARGQGVVEAHKNAADAVGAGASVPGPHPLVRPRSLRPRQHQLSRVRPGLHQLRG